MIPKPHWSALERLIALCLAMIQFPEVRLDEFSKKWRFFKKCCKKSYLYDPEAFFFLAKLWFSLMKQKSVSPAPELLEFFDEILRDFLKKKSQKN